MSQHFVNLGCGEQKKDRALFFSSTVYRLFQLSGKVSPFPFDTVTTQTLLHNGRHHWFEWDKTKPL